jgi:uncharacterized protein (DUF697 family)
VAKGKRTRSAKSVAKNVDTVGRVLQLVPEGRRGTSAPAAAATKAVLEHKARLTGVVIHGFALAHGATAATLSQTLVGDEVALTGLTTAMIMSISRLHGRDWEVGESLALIGAMAGFYLGTRGAVFLVKWVPLVGNAANALASVAVAEILGWATYILVREDRKPSDLSKGEAKEVYHRAQRLRESMEEEAKRLVQALSPTDRAQYDRLIRRLKIRDLPKKDREAALRALDGLVTKYGG